MQTMAYDAQRAEFSPFHGEEIDDRSGSGKLVVNLEEGMQGVRALYAAVMRLSIYLERNPAVEKACLVLRGPRMSLARVQQEWGKIKKTLRTSITRRLGVMVVEEGATWIDPDEPAFRRVAKNFEPALSAESKPLSQPLNKLAHPSAPRPTGRKSHEVVKVLLSRWLQKQGPIPQGELSRQVGCSYPTLRAALERPSFQRHLAFTSSRSVELKSFPHEAWRELVVLSDSLRGSVRFRDRSGEWPNLQSLLKRLERLKPPNVALGGVHAARFWHPEFDLNGTPRLDLILHAPEGEMDLEWVQKLDPALGRTDDPEAAAVVVVHPLVRAEPFFVSSSFKEALPLADPVETALDLCELSLTAQANQLLTHLRREVRLA